MSRGNLSVKRLRTEAERFHHARAVVLHEDVEAGEQTQQQIAAFGPAEIERHRSLPAVAREEEVRVPLRTGQAELATLAGLDLHHVGPVVGEEHRAERTREVAREIEDANAGQRGGCVSHDSATPELRSALLEERAHAFPVVLALEAGLDGGVHRIDVASGGLFG